MSHVITPGQIITGAQQFIGEVSGAGTQAYSEDRMLADVIRSFDLLFTRYPWPHYREWSQHDLDGTTGKLDGSTDFSDVRGIEDFLYVAATGASSPLPMLLSRTNPYQIRGNSVGFWTFLKATHADFWTKRLQFYPLAATGSVDILRRVYPTTNDDPWTTDTEIVMDKSMMEYCTAFMTLSQDDLNPNGAATAQALMEERYSQIIAALSAHDTLISGNSGGYPNSWFVNP